MADVFESILTTRGKSKLSACITNGTMLPVTTMAVGSGLNEGYYTLDPAATALKKEVHRGQINALYPDPLNPGWIIAELAIPANVGGWNIREAMLFDSTGEAFSAALIPLSYKPVSASERSNKSVVIQMAIAVGTPAAVNLLVDASAVYATHAYVSTEITRALAAAISISLMPNGYVKLPGGFIKQWGQGVVGSSGYLDVTFPVAFTTATYMWQATAYINTDESSIRCMGRDDVYNATSKTGCRFTMRSWLGGKTNGGFTYMVIGK